MDHPIQNKSDQDRCQRQQRTLFTEASFAFHLTLKQTKMEMGRIRDQEKRREEREDLEEDDEIIQPCNQSGDE